MRNALRLFFPELEVRWPRTFVALSHRNFQLFFFGQLISLIGTWMQSVAQSWLVYRLTGSPLALGLVGFAGSVPILLFSLWGGVLADRFPKRNLLLISQTAAMLQAVLLALLTLMGIVQVWQIMVLAFILGTIQAIDIPTRQAFVEEMVGREDLANAIALNSTSFNSARILGPATAGILVATAGEGPAFLINALSFLAAISALLLMRLDMTPSPVPQMSPMSDLRQGLGYIRSHGEVLTIVSLVGVSSLFCMPYVSLMAIFARDILNVGAPGLGTLTAAAGLGAVIGALTLASLGNSQAKGRLLTLGNLLFPAMLFFFALSRSYLLSLIILVGAGWAMVAQNATANTLLQSLTPRNIRGRVMSGFTLTFAGMMPLGNLQAGIVAAFAGAPTALGLGAILAWVFGLLVFWRVSPLRRLP